MAKKINIIANLIDKQFKKQMADLQKGKYKINVDVNGEKVNSANKSMKQLNNTAASTNSTFGKLKDTISNTFSSGKIAMTAYLMVLNEISKAGKNAKQTIKDLDESITDLSVAMGEGRSVASDYLSTLNKQAKIIGATTKETADSADSWIRQGKSIAETEELIYDSMILSKLGKIESADASTYLTAALNGYKLEAKDAIDVVDKLTAVDMESASDAGGLAESLSKCSSAANMADVSFDKLIGMISTVKEVTQDSDEAVGNMFKSVFSRMNQIKAGKFVDLETGESLNDTEKVLNKVGISMRDANNEFRSSEKILDEVGTKWQNFDSTTQRAVATAMAGIYQYNKLIALFDNYGNTLKYTETAANSAGTAVDKFNESYLNSLESKENILQASFESMIMNSDFDEVYGGILDATTALVDFINETNALKSVMGGLAVGIGVKAFISIKSGIHEAYVTLNKFQNAINIVGKAKISTKEFDKLLLLSNGLSKSQMKLIVSTNALSVSQKKELLIASGLSEEEAVLQLQTWKMTSANTGLTASATSASNAFRGLWATIKANQLGLIITGVTIGISAWQKYKQSVEDAVSSANEAANAYNETASSIDEYVAKYQDLRKQFIAAKGNEEDTYNIKQQLLELQTELNEQFGEEYKKLNLVTDSYKDQTEAIKAYSKESAKTFLNENRKGIEKATKEMENDDNYYLGSMNGLVDSSELKYLDEIKKIASENNIDFTDRGFEFTGKAEEASESINNFMNQITELQKQAGDTSTVLERIFDGILDNSGDALTDVDSIIDEYSEIYNQAKLAEIASDNKLSSGYSELTNAVTEYNDAIANSDNPYNDENVQNAYNNLQTLKQGIDDNKKEWGKYSDVVQKVYNEADTSSYDFYNAIKNNTDGVGNLANELKGLSDVDLQAMIDDGNNEKTFNKLSKEAEKYGLTIDELISLLEILGYVQGEVTSKNEEVSSIPSTEELEEQINNFNSVIDEIQSTYDTLSSVVEEYNSQGFLSLDTLQSLMSLSDEYLACLVNENGQLSLNSDMLNTLTQAKLAEAEATAIDQAIKELDTIATNDATTATADYITGNANLMQSLALLAGQYDNVANAAMTAAQAQSLSASIESANAKNSAATANVMAGLNTKLSLIRSTSSSISKRGIGNVSKKSSNSAKSSAKKTMEDIQKEWKEYLDKYLAMYKAELDAGLIDFNTFLNKSRSLLDEFYRDGKISAKDYWDSVKSLYENQLSIYDKVLSAVTRRIEKEVDGIQDIIDGLEKQNDALQKQLDKYDSILSAVEEVYDNRIDVLNKQKEAIQDNIDKLQDENDEHNRALELEKAKWNLYKAMNNRTKRVFNGTEFIYKTDRNEVREAQKNLQDLTLEQTISAMEKEIGLLEDQIEVLEEFKSKWSDISDAYEKEVNRQNAILLWGREYEKMILSNRLSDIDSFKNSYISIQQQIDDNEGLIESYNEKVDYYNKLKEQWSDISKAYEQSQEDQYASMVLGAQWESDVLSGRIDVLNNFKNQYIAIQQAITNAALEAARAQANAQSIQASSASSGGGGSSYSGASSTNSGNEKVLHLQRFMNQVFGSNLTEDGIMGSKTKEAIKHMQLLIGANQTGVYDKATYNKLKYYVGKILKENNKTLYNIAKSLGYPAYAKGTTNAKKGVALVSEKEHGDEIIIDNNDNAYVAEGEQLHYFEGGETVIKASESEKILTNMENLTPLQDYVSPFSGMNLQPIDYSSMVMSSLNLPDFSKLTVKNNTTPVVQNITMTLPNVTNESGYEKITKELKQAQLDAMQFAHRR